MAQCWIRTNDQSVNSRLLTADQSGTHKLFYEEMEVWLKISPLSSRNF